MTQTGWTPDYASPLPVAGPPGVLPWFKAYAGFMALLYLAVLAGGVFLLLKDWTTVPDVDPVEMRINGWVLTAVGPPLMLAFGLALFLPLKKWVWIYDVVLIGIGLTSCCFWPVCIPLLIFWVRPETRRWFGWG